MTTTKADYDFIAIGVGPMNLGLACLTAPISELNGLFLDKKDAFNWHSGMLLEDTTLQIPFMGDLVTLADPTSPYSFLNYLKAQGKIYSFYIRENFLVLRQEYNQYCQWAIKKLPNVYFKTEVTQVHYDANTQLYNVHALSTSSGTTKCYTTKKLVLGTGTQPYVPACCKHLKGAAIHSSMYLSEKSRLQGKKVLTVVGSGQSAAEVFYDLLQDIDTCGYALHWMTRSPRFFPLEYAKLTLEMTSPEYVDYFYDLPSEKRESLIKNQKHLYKGINQDLIANIYDLIYTKQVSNRVAINLRTNSELIVTNYDKALDTFYLQFHQCEQDKYFQHDTEALILATGYAYQTPQFIEGIKDRIQWDAKGKYAVHRNYSIDHDGNSIFVQNAELHTHGFVTPDLGMACYRNSHIIATLTGKAYYALEKRIAFQQFEVTEEEEVTLPNSVV
jgi:lysine N6-hydroxylase